jgi:hypothetical protein
MHQPVVMGALAMRRTARLPLALAAAAGDLELVLCMKRFCRN